jgi:hypothetical protein
MQGFTGLDDTALAEIGLWLRVAPAICSALIAVATLLGYALGAALVLATGVAATTDFCMGCFIHRRLIGAPAAREKTPH